ncbi:hypothetical protein B0H17DRAFT_1190234 [Mycena rosella]|uniref:Uncharacterized protein n=1 Tax=Mycena rosella TaxID=1033263 RepID=A0AAD7H223_MYCRO|nr:hypothetical protein B0H17DRAFT_1190234 [Mycena rosella]
MDGPGTDSPPLRNTILAPFPGRGRPRNSSQSHIDVAAARELSPSPPTAQPPSPIPIARRRCRTKRKGPAVGSILDCYICVSPFRRSLSSLCALFLTSSLFLSNSTPFPSSDHPSF